MVMDMGHTESRAFDALPEAGALRPLGWSELCARLVAAQDLRRVSATAPDARAPRQGSFHQGAAALIGSAEPGAHSAEAGAQDFVNPTSSTNGKGNHGIDFGTSEIPLNERQSRQSDENRHD